MEKSNNVYSVNVPVTTLKAINIMLYGEKGMNLSPLIEDLTEEGLPGSKDLAKMQIALLMKGYKPSLKEAVGCIIKNKDDVKCVALEYSLLRGTVHYTENYDGIKVHDVCSIGEWVSLKDWEDPR